MIVNKCDICGKETSTWLVVTVSPNASNAVMNVADLMKYCGTVDICPECFENKARDFFLGERCMR